MAGQKIQAPKGVSEYVPPRSAELSLFVNPSLSQLAKRVIN